MATFEVQTTGCIWFTQRLCYSCGSVSKRPDWAENELHPPRRPLVRMLGMLTRVALNFLAPQPTSCSSLEFIGFAEMFSFRKLLRSEPSLSWGCRLWWDRLQMSVLLMFFRRAQFNTLFYWLVKAMHRTATWPTRMDFWLCLIEQHFCLWLLHIEWRETAPLMVLSSWT